jgi:hypothetical protein
MFIWLYNSSFFSVLCEKLVQRYTENIIVAIFFKSMVLEVILKERRPDGSSCPTSLDAKL